jgi:hypothetical protein
MLWLVIVMMQLQLVFEEYPTIQGKMKHPNLIEAPDKLEYGMLIVSLTQSAIHKNYTLYKFITLLL